MLFVLKWKGLLKASRTSASIRFHGFPYIGVDTIAIFTCVICTRNDTQAYGLCLKNTYLSLTTYFVMNPYANSHLLVTSVRTRLTYDRLHHPPTPLNRADQALGRQSDLLREHPNNAAVMVDETDISLPLLLGINPLLSCCSA
jgi:hypothetical protein